MDKPVGEYQLKMMSFYKANLSYVHNIFSILPYDKNLSQYS